MDNNWNLQGLLAARARDNVTVPGLTPKVNWGSVVSGGMDLLCWGLNKYRVSKALQSIEPDIAKFMPKDGGGVLVLVSYCTATGDSIYNGKLFQNAAAQLGASTATEAFNRYTLRNANGSIYASCPEGWNRSEEFLWVSNKQR